MAESGGYCTCHRNSANARSYTGGYLKDLLERGRKAAE